MIPRRIRLAGFLSYRDEQELDFTESNLWMLSGANGSGKSAIFDAVTFALYGQHRGGATDAVELIHKNANALAVEFEFQLEGRLYKIRRTVARRNQAKTQQVWQWNQGQWEAVPETQKGTSFNRWIVDHIGLKYDAFTSSVLLLQGRAEQLLESRAKQRAEILAQIVDLSRYQKLFEEADQERKDLKARVDALKAQLEGLPIIAPERIAEADRQWQEMHSRLDSLIQRGQQLAAIKVQAEHWAKTQEKLHSHREELSRWERILKEGTQIQKDWHRLMELRQALPSLKKIVEVRMDLDRAAEKFQQLQKEQRENQADWDAKNAELSLLQTKVEKAEALITAHEQKLVEREAKRSALAEPLADISKLEVHERHLARYQEDLRGLPTDLGERLQRQQERFDSISKAEKALPSLRRFADLRREIGSVVGKLREIENHFARLTTAQDETDRRLAEAKRCVEDSKAKLQAVSDELTSQRTLETEAKKALREFNSLEGQRLCRMCGQPLTPEHWQAEHEAREQALRQVQQRLAQLKNELAAAEDEHRRTVDDFEKIQKAYANLQAERQALDRDRDHYQKTLTRLRSDRATCLAELDAEICSRLVIDDEADPQADHFPSETDLDALAQQVALKSQVLQELDRLKSANTLARERQAQIKETEAEIQTIRRRLPDSPEAILSQATDLDLEVETLKGQISKARASAHEDRNKRDRLRDEMQRLRDSISSLEAELGKLDERINSLTQQKEATLQLLPPEWRDLAESVALTEIHRLHRERDQLEKDDTEQRYHDYQQAQAKVEQYRRGIADLESEIESIPPEVRRLPSEVEAEIQDTRSAQQAAARDEQKARDEWRRLESEQAQRAKLQREIQSLENEFRLAKTLAELLGRDRLQRHLVRRAERQIVNFANAVLDRLSSGTIYLRLAGTEDANADDEALQLEAVTRVTGDHPISVAFLSGSQRFRVAVSLALGMGQFANQLHRPIESIIIDEGFGCLDREGRQSMIQELHQLRGLLSCIILVSHQEEFASAFADGYRFELRDGATVVERVRR